MDTRAQNSWKELIEKEAATRIQCKFRLEETKKQDEHGLEPPKNKTKKTFKYESIKDDQTNTSDYMKPLSFPPKAVHRNLHDEIQNLKQQLELNKTDLLKDMRPVSQELNEQLYDGFSKEGKGRSKYLKNRKQFLPEQKYEYPLVSSFEYGWKLGEIYKQEYKNPEHGRNKIVEDSFYRRNGVF